MGLTNISQGNVPSAYVLSLVVFVAMLSISACGMSWLLGERRGPYHNTTALADLDRDGDLDVIVTNLRYESEVTMWHQITLWTNQGQGRFTPKRYQTPSYLYLSAASGDVDDDGDADMVVLRSDQLQFFLNQGGVQGGDPGEFAPDIGTRPVGTGTPGSVVLGDLNNDGKLDGFVAGCCGMSVPGQDGRADRELQSISWVWINQQGRERTQRRTPMVLEELNGVRVRAADLGDLDGDGDLDIFTAVLTPKAGRAGSPADRVFLNDGSGDFTDSGQRLGDADSSSVALGDLDADGDLDTLVGTGNGAVVWINQGGAQGGQAGVFRSSESEIGGNQTDAVFLEDLDGDGDVDALIGGTSQATMWWNDGQGTFERSNQRFRYTERHAVAIGDFNGDGHPDVFAGAYTETHSVWFNRGDGTFRSAP